MTDGAQREMTLAEYVDGLPDDHHARVEYRHLQRVLREAQLVVEQRREGGTTDDTERAFVRAVEDACAEVSRRPVRHAFRGDPDGVCRFPGCEEIEDRVTLHGNPSPRETPASRTTILAKKARAFDRVNDRLAEFGDDADTALRCVGEDIQTWDHEHPEDVTVGQLIDGLDYDACVTGDCPHDQANDCLASLTKSIRWFCGEANVALGLTGQGSRVVTHDGPALKFWYDRDSDILTIEGVRFAGGLFRTLAWPRDDRWYRFTRQGPDLVVSVIDMPVRAEPPAGGNA